MKIEINCIFCNEVFERTWEEPTLFESNLREDCGDSHLPCFVVCQDCCSEVWCDDCKLEFKEVINGSL